MLITCIIAFLTRICLSDDSGRLLFFQITKRGQSVKKICLVLAMLAFCGVGIIEGTDWTMYFFKDNNTIYCTFPNDLSLFEMRTDKPTNKLLGKIEKVKNDNAFDTFELYETIKPSSFDPNLSYKAGEYIKFTSDDLKQLDDYSGKYLMDLKIGPDNKLTVMEKITEILTDEWKLVKKEEKEKLEKERLEKEKKEEKPKIGEEKKPESEYEMYLYYIPSDNTLNLQTVKPANSNKSFAIFDPTENLKPDKSDLKSMQIKSEDRVVTVYLSTGIPEDTVPFVNIKLDNYYNDLIENDLKFLNETNKEKNTANIYIIKEWSKQYAPQKAQQEPEVLGNKPEPELTPIEYRPLYDLAFILSKM